MCIIGGLIDFENNINMPFLFKLMNKENRSVYITEHAIFYLLCGETQKTKKNMNFSVIEQDGEIYSIACVGDAEKSEILTLYRQMLCGESLRKQRTGSSFCLYDESRKRVFIACSKEETESIFYSVCDGKLIFSTSNEEMKETLGLSEIFEVKSEEFLSFRGGDGCVVREM